MKHVLYFHILSFLCFAESDMKHHVTDKAVTLWRLRTLFDILRDLFAKIYNLLECVVIDELILKFKGQVIFRQSVPKKNKHCSIKIFNSFVT